MENCFVTKLKGVVNDNSLPFLGLGLLVFDNTINPTQSDTTNRVNVAGGDFTALDVSTYTTITSTRVLVSTSAPAGTFLRFLFKYNLTEFVSASTQYCNMSPRFSDICQCKDALTLNFSGMYTFDDDYDISKLGLLTKLQYLNLAGKTSSKWYGDVVDLADSMLDNGKDLTSQSVLVISHYTGTATSGVKVNGNSYARYIHIVFNGSGYKIYAPINSSSPLSDYSGETPVYTKAL